MGSDCIRVPDHCLSFYFTYSIVYNIHFTEMLVVVDYRK